MHSNAGRTARRIPAAWLRGSNRAAGAAMFVAAVLVFLSGPLLAQGVSPVVVSAVVEREVITGQSFIGTVMPLRQTTIGSAVDGRVLKVYVDEGDPVDMLESSVAADAASETDADASEELGQPLVQLRTATLEIEIATAQAELELRRQELAELEVVLPEQLAQAQARVLSTEATQTFAKSKYTRTETLFKQGRSVSKEELDEAYSIYVAAEQNHAVALSQQNEIVGSRDAKVGQAKARLLMQQEAMNQLEDLKKKYTIRAPYKGYVTALHTEVGAWIKKGDPIAEVVELDPIEVDVSVPEAYVDRLQQAVDAAVAEGELLRVSIQVGSLPGQVFDGAVTRIVPQADVRSRAFPVKIRVPNPAGEGGHTLKAGMLARANLSVGRKQKSLLAPKDALVLGGRSPSVFVIVDGGQSGTTVREVPVVVGAAFGSLIEIQGDLSPGAKVVVRGNERLRPGQPVRVTQELKVERP